MKAADFIVTIAALQHGSDGPAPSLFVVDLDRTDEGTMLHRLPPCPVIGVGDSGHPLAQRLDCLVEQPIRADSLCAAICAQPLTAAIFVQLLRAIEGMDPQQALVVESLAFAALQGGAEHAAWLAGQKPGRKFASGTIELEREGDVLRIVVDRPEAANAIDVALRDALKEALDLAAIDRKIARIELRGAGRAFGVGADLAEFGTTRDPPRAHHIRMQTLPALSAIACADRMVSHVQGLCVGSSLELAAFGRIEARRNALFQLPELSMGIIPGAGGCVSLSRKIGRQRTALMVLSGRRIRAQTALDWGLADAIVD